MGVGCLVVMSKPGAANPANSADTEDQDNRDKIARREHD
jgi:hypothetical protein